MTSPAARLRIFAGPNGSGKSTIKEHLPPAWLGVYVNADEIEQRIRSVGHLDLTAYAITPQTTDFLDFVSSATLLKQKGLSTSSNTIRLENNQVWVKNQSINSYYAAVVADFLRHQLLLGKQSFTFETVMSSPDKVAFMHKAHAAGFRVYLYFVATEDPQINVSRVAHRVAQGGHNVPADKIISRYHRSLDLLNEAVQAADRAYVFDNSGDERVWIAEVTDGNELEIKTDLMPYWFKTALWDKFESQ